MSRKRDKPYFSRQAPYSFPKRRRPLPTSQSDSPENSSAKTPTTLIVTGISPDCSILDLKSRFEIYGCISRTRMDPGGVAYITFRSKDSAESAIAASLDPSFGIGLDSKSVQVMWANDPVPQWREGVRKKDSPSSSSKLLKAELPLSRHGRGNRLGSAIVNPRSNNSDSGLDVPFKAREIVAYDDIL
ncbi:hypothetical protein F0562_032860 [Nyssa sinensis]|uniref:RRM domain-containing protein n=1 Tax=Nyssa sinensis TaxID=561372 RepID=A0A5J5APU7_9ASTE|nr:hypothetical protein F0562_032860 [Nyssa sinensis]